MSRSQNGRAQNPAYLLTFDLNSEAQYRAWGVIQKLAEKRRSKKTLIGFLLALEEVQRLTGEEYSVEDMMARFVTSIITGNSLMATSPRPALGDLSEESPSLIVGTADHADPDAIRDQLAISMGNLFDD